MRAKQPMIAAIVAAVAGSTLVGIELHEHQPGAGEWSSTGSDSTRR